jgi:hypothetical protein
MVKRDGFFTTVPFSPIKYQATATPCPFVSPALRSSPK